MILQGWGGKNINFNNFPREKDEIIVIVILVYKFKYCRKKIKKNVTNIEENLKEKKRGKEIFFFQVKTHNSVLSYDNTEQTFTPKNAEKIGFPSEMKNAIKILKTT